MQVFKFPLQKEILQSESIWKVSGGAGICSQVSGCRGAGKGSRQGAVSVVAVVAIALREVSLEPNRRSGAVREPRGGWEGSQGDVRGSQGGRWCHLKAVPMLAAPQERKCGWKVVLQRRTGV